MPKTSPKALSENRPESAGKDSAGSDGYVRRSGQIALVAVILAIIIGSLARLQTVTEPFWLDELHTAWSVDGSFYQVADRAAHGNQAALYFWLVWPIVQLAGMSELALRLLSLFAGFILVCGASWTVWKLTQSAVAAVFVAWVMALDPNLIFYATEARPYALVQVVAFVQILLFALVWKNEVTPNQTHSAATLVGFVISTATLFYLHYSTVLLLATEFALAFVTVMVLFQLRVWSDSKESRGRNVQIASTELLVRLIVLAGISLLVFLPSLTNVRSVWQRRGNWVNVSSVEGLVAELFPIFMILFVLPAVILGIVLTLQRTRPSSAPPQTIFLLPILAACAVGPPILAIAFDYFRLAPLALSRYIVSGQVALFLFAGVSIGLLPTQKIRLAVGLLLALLVCWQNPLVGHFAQHRSLPTFRHENWREAIAEINELRDKRNWPVFLFANLLEDKNANSNIAPDFQEYLRFPLIGAFKVDRSNREIVPMPTMAENPFMETHMEAIEGEGGAWFVIRASRERTSQILAAFDSWMNREYQTDFFASPSSDVILIKITIEELGN